MQRRLAQGRSGWLPLALLAAALLSGPAALLADADPALRPNPNGDELGLEFGRRETIKVDVEMALINVTVTDPTGRMVTGLGKEHFRIQARVVTTMFFQVAGRPLKQLAVRPCLSGSHTLLVRLLVEVAH